MQSTAVSPRNLSAVYRDFADDVEYVEQCGFHSVWTAQHRFWYDGWCPALLHAQAFAAARTRRIRFGNCVLLLAQQDARAFAEAALTLARLTGGRVDVGVGLGHRDAEFDGLGLSRRTRGRRMDTALETLGQVWRESCEDGPPQQRAGPPLLIGGMTQAALERAGKHGYGIVMPQSLTSAELRKRVDSYRSQPRGTGTVVAMRDVWVTSDEQTAAAHRARLDRHYREEAGSWWVIKDTVGFIPPERLDAQMERIQSCAIVGSADEVATGLTELFEAGADLVSIRTLFDFVDRPEFRAQVARIANEVLPVLDAARAQR